MPKFVIYSLKKIVDGFFGAIVIDLTKEIPADEYVFVSNRMDLTFKLVSLKRSDRVCNCILLYGYDGL